MYRLAGLVTLLVATAASAQTPGTVVNQLGPAHGPRFHRCGFDTWRHFRMKEELALLVPLRNLGDPAAAAGAIEKLRQREHWEATERILALYHDRTYDTPEVQRAIIRFALQSADPSARDFIRQRERELPWLRQIRKTLEIEEMVNPASARPARD